MGETRHTYHSKYPPGTCVVVTCTVCPLVSLTLAFPSNPPANAHHIAHYCIIRDSSHKGTKQKANQKCRHCSAFHKTHREPGTSSFTSSSMPPFSSQRPSLFLLPVLALVVLLLLAVPVEAGWLGSLFGRKDKQQVGGESGGRGGCRKSVVGGREGLDIGLKELGGSERGRDLEGRWANIFSIHASNTPCNRRRP